MIVLQLGIDRHVTIRSLTPLLHNSMMMMTMIRIIIIKIIVNIQIIIIDMWLITLLLQNLILVMIAMTGKVFDHQNISICICINCIFVFVGTCKLMMQCKGRSRFVGGSSITFPSRETIAPPFYHHHDTHFHFYHRHDHCGHRAPIRSSP